MGFVAHSLVLNDSFSQMSLIARGVWVGERRAKLYFIKNFNSVGINILNTSIEPLLSIMMIMDVMSKYNVHTVLYMHVECKRDPFSSM